MKKLFLFAGILLISAACNTQPAPSSATLDYTIVRINQAELRVEVADDSDSRRQGLSGRPSMAEHQGMLFDFRGTDQVRPGFWMKDMRFGLDLIWIANNRVVGITPNVPPPMTGQTLTNYYPPDDIDTVIEVNAGWTQRNGVKVGDVVSY